MAKEDQFSEDLKRRDEDTRRMANTSLQPNAIATHRAKKEADGLLAKTM